MWNNHSRLKIFFCFFVIFVGECLATKNESLATKNESFATKNEILATKNESLVTNNEINIEPRIIGEENTNLSNMNESLVTNNESLLTKNESLATKNESLVTNNEINIEPRIIGGENANWSNSKHIVSIRVKTKDFWMGFGSGHQCAGTLISNTLVLTAAHCLINKVNQMRDPSEFIVIMGTLNLYSAYNNTEKLNVKDIILHRYDESTMENDIAIMILDRNIIKNNSNILPMKISRKTPDPGSPCFIHGWGITKYGGRTLARDLQVVQVPIIAREECMKKLGNSIKDGMICAGSMAGNEDACQGDSGGPLMCNDTLVGVISGGKGCGLPNYPGVYSEVAHYQNWIDDNKQKIDNARYKNTEYLRSPIINRNKHPRYGKGNGRRYMEDRVFEEDNANSKFFVSIRKKDDEGQYQHICGGALISKNLVLTATQCLINNEKKPIEIRKSDEFIVVMGTLNLFDDTNTENFNVKAIYHNEFDVETKQNDIAIMILDGNITGNNSNIEQLKLSTKTPNAGSICYVHGWGVTDIEDIDPRYDFNILEVRIITGKECRIKYGEKIKDGMICTDYYKESKDICLGDSGSPLVCNNTLVGVFSGRGKCALPNFPGIYSEVAYFRNWIDDNKQDKNVANLKDAKYFASIRPKLVDNDNFGEKIIAGGALITIENEFYLVTTAHSLYFGSNILMRPEKMSVVFNTVNRFQKANESLIFDVDKIIIHPKYDHNKKVNDIAVLKFNEKYFDKLKSLKSLKIANKLSNSTCVTLGYGVNNPLEDDDDTDPLLHYANMSVYSRYECNPKYANILMDDWICGGEMEYLQDRNQPNDGGPLVCNEELTGLMIRHSSIAYKGFPSIFVDLTKHRDWLSKRIRETNSANNFFKFSYKVIMIVSIIFKIITN